MTPAKTNEKTPAQLVREHRKHFLDRKLSRSPMLGFKPGVSGRLDISKLLEKTTPNLPFAGGEDFAASTPGGLIQGLLGDRGSFAIPNPDSKLVKKLQLLKTRAADCYQNTGQHALYIGYPCVVIPVEKKAARYAPLFLFSVEITVSQAKIEIKRKQDESGVDDALLNRLLVAYVKQNEGYEIAGLNEFRFPIDASNIQDKVDQIASRWVGLKNDFNFASAYSIDAFSEAVFKRATFPECDPYIASHAVLGLAEFSGQSLLSDLDKIAQALDGGEACSAPLLKLLTASSLIAESTPDAVTRDEDKWLVEKSDPCQEQVVWAQRGTSNQSPPLVLLQGPPGTGKSQTIVNVIADRVARGENVMLVCQKKAATDVVHKRLTGAKLEGLAATVHDLEKDRAPILKNIKDLTPYATPRGLACRADVANSIETFEKRLDAVANMFDDDSGGRARNWADIHTKLHGLNLFDKRNYWNKPLVEAINGAFSFTSGRFDKTNFDDFIKPIKDAMALARQASYPSNQWSAAKLQDISPEQLRELHLDIGRLSELTKRAGSSDTNLAQLGQPSAWLNEHPWVSAAHLPVNASKSIAMIDPDSDDGREYQHFAEWLELLRTLKSVNARIDVDGLIGRYKTNPQSLDCLIPLIKDAVELDTIIRLKRDVANNAVLSALHASFKQSIEHWASYAEAIVLHYWLTNLESRHAQFFHDQPHLTSDSDIAALKQNLDIKRQLDAHEIQSKFKHKVTAKNHLEAQNLLASRASTKGNNAKNRTSLRTLYSQGSDAVNLIQPVLLSSPETASALLPLKPNMYDLVIIDEASQMFVAEAIPMLYHAKSALIAGDRMQMPPSCDFVSSGQNTTNDFDDDGEEKDETGHLVAPVEGENRLLEAADRALGQGSPNKMMLEVHYRSARKELIDFSNHAFYEGKLVTPSGNGKLLPFMTAAIHYVEVNDGVFETGLNRPEAKRIVSKLAEIWLYNYGQLVAPTVGVIVNNVRQRDLIEELLQDKADNEPAFFAVYQREKTRTTNGGEDVSFFVRSVESVQGDERDLILFGFTYGGARRLFGKLSTQEDGRRRLNVAITRAKRGMYVFCSHTNLSAIAPISEQSQKTERFYVQQYLMYAKAVSENDSESIRTVLNAVKSEKAIKNQVEMKAYDSLFEAEVAKYIRSLNYFVEPQVGESGFRIDLGIKLNENELNYICGVECDGATYHTGWSARTRDVWRQGILEDKGWNILRVWSTDWFKDQTACKLEIKNQINALANAATGLTD
jgi:DNA polymerase III delta prime subunit